MGRPAEKYLEALHQLEKERWYDLDEIMDYIQKNVDILDEELERSKPDNPMPIWKHRVYSALNHSCLREGTEHKPRVAAKKSPTGHYIPPQYMWH